MYPSRPPSLSPAVLLHNSPHGIRSLMEFGNPVRPLALSVLYPHGSSLHAVPRYISGRTSYHQVRLAFHPYPHLIRRFFNNDQFGPPLPVKKASPWTWIDHLASRLLHATNALIRLAFATATRLNTLNLATYSKSRVHSTKGTPSHWYCYHSALTVCRRTVSGSFHSPPGVLFTLSLTVLKHYRSRGSI